VFRYASKEDSILRKGTSLSGKDSLNPFGELKGRFGEVQFHAEGWSSLVYTAKLLRASGPTVPVVLKHLKRAIPDHSGESSRSGLIEAFVREALALSVARGSGLPILYDFLWIDRRPCLVMSHLPGETLRQALELNRILNLSKVVHIVRQILALLSRVHNSGWIHCDINPGNILLESNKVSLIDFGAVQRKGSTPFWNWPLGRHRFMSPEHLRVVTGDGAHLTEQSDLYQLACLIIYLLSGEQLFRDPFDDESYADYLKELANWMSLSPGRKLGCLTKQPWPPGEPEGLTALIHKALEPEPARRFGSAREMRQALDGLC
jgi:serine/threonine protein kinase